MRGIIIALAMACAGLEGCASMPARRVADAGPSLDALVFSVPPGHRLYHSVTLGGVYGLPGLSPLAGLSQEGLRRELEQAVEASDMLAPSPASARYSLEVESSVPQGMPLRRRAEGVSETIYRLVDRRSRTTAFFTVVDNRGRNSGWAANDPLARVAAGKPLHVRAPRQSVAGFLLALSQQEHIPMKKIIPCSNGINIQEERAALQSQGYGWVESHCPSDQQRSPVIF